MPFVLFVFCFICILLRFVFCYVCILAICMLSFCILSCLYFDFFAFVFCFILPLYLFWLYYGTFVFWLTTVMDYLCMHYWNWQFLYTLLQVKTTVVHTSAMDSILCSPILIDNLSCAISNIDFCIQDWVAFMSQPYCVEVKVEVDFEAEVDLMLRLKWGWDEVEWKFSWNWVELWLR